MIYLQMVQLLQGNGSGNLPKKYYVFGWCICTDDHCKHKMTIQYEMSVKYLEENPYLNNNTHVSLFWFKKKASICEICVKSTHTLSFVNFTLVFVDIIIWQSAKQLPDIMSE